MADESRIAQLIARQLCASISEEEKKELDQWIDESPVHQQFMETRMRPEILNKIVIQLLDMDHAAIWKKFDRLKTANGKSLRQIRSERLKNIWNYITAAAAIAALALMPSIRNKYSYPPNFTADRTKKIIETIAKQENIKVEQMTLTLSNGIKVPIDNSPRPTKESGYRIVSEEEGYLAYVRYNSHSQSVNVYNTLTTAQNAGSSILLMPDGTITDLGPGTSLRYPLASAESTGSRVVTLHGEAIFNVFKNPNAPFLIESKRLETSALGTVVRVRDYGLEEGARVSVLSGKVEVRNGMDSVFLTPGQGVMAVEYQPALRFFSDFFSVPEPIQNSGMFHFTDRTTGSIMREISRWYGMAAPKFQDIDSTISGQLGTGDLSRSLALDSLLTLIATKHIHFTVDGDTILIHK